MQLYSLYQTFAYFFSQTGKFDLESTLLLAVISGIVWLLPFFLLQGFGLYAMARNRDVKGKALAFVPFANVLFAGKLAGECSFFGQKLKRTGLYAMIAQIVSTLFGISMMAAEIYLYTTHGMPTTQTMFGTPCWIGLEGFSEVAYGFYETVGYIVPIFYLAFRVLWLILLMGLFRQYSPKNYTALGALTFFFPEAAGITIFALRNRKAIDYDAYMQAKREEFFRRRQEYRRHYGNPYGNPYQNPYNQNPYNGNPYNGANYGQEENRDEDPFAEFASERKKDDDMANGDNPFDEFSK